MLIGKCIVQVFLASDDLAVKLVTDTGEDLIIRVDGDCCAHSFFQHVELPVKLPFVIQGVEDYTLESIHAEYGDVTDRYGCKLITSTGIMDMECRTEHNGYYGGNIVLPGEDTYFYGGVYGQNISNENWIELT